MRDLAKAVYRQVAEVSASILATSPVVESVLLHRSAATGEISFGRSDIDLLMIVNEDRAEDGENMAALCKLVQRARLFNPALSHIEVYDPHSLASMARLDTFWGSSERRSMLLLRGSPVAIPDYAVHPDHALGRFLLWVEYFFAIALQQRNQRNLWKTSLECWNAYATAEGMIGEPCLLRNEMESQARRIETGLDTDRLGEPGFAAQFVFGLAHRLHRSRLPALQRLAKPLTFGAITAPLCLQRQFVILPRADSSLPQEVFTEGAFPCTPEILDLFLHFKNAFFSWIVPHEVLQLGMQPPTVPAMLRACQYYSHSRFLLIPGFADPRPATQPARMALIRHAAEYASRGELPPAVPQRQIQEAMAQARPVADYYKTEYGLLRRESRQLQGSLDSLLGAAWCT